MSYDLMNCDLMSCDPPTSRQQICGLILAGGQGRRMGGADKGLLPLQGRPLIAWVLERLLPQVGSVLISANRNQERYARFGWPLIGDQRDGYCGPLAGIDAGLHATTAPWLLVVPCDTPQLPHDLAQRLTRALASDPPHPPLAACNDGQRTHPTCALLHRPSLQQPVRQRLQRGEYRLMEWLQQTPHRLADYRDTPHAFANLNHPEELAKAEQSAKRKQHIFPCS